MSQILPFPIYELRPANLPHDSWWRGPWLRFADGAWQEDDGTSFDLAWYSIRDPIALYMDLPHHRNLAWSWYTKSWTSYEERHPRGNAWHYMLSSGQRWIDWPYTQREQHPNISAGRRAMDRCCARFSCANGRGARFELGDEHIAQGLVRERETGQTVTFPDSLVCMYCGPVPWPARLLRT